MDKKARIVVKVEIETLFDNEGTLSHDKVEQLSMICSNLNNSGAQALIVSSGAIALGTARLGLKEIPTSITVKQATAAVGQAELIQLYQDHLESYSQMAAQVLLTKDVIDNPVRNKNARNTLEKLLEKGIIPVINENDSVSTSDIILNNNYPLVLIVASLTDADAVVVNTYQDNEFFLMYKNNSSIMQAGIEDLLELSQKITTGRITVDNEITGFPDFCKFAGLNQKI